MVACNANANDNGTPEGLNVMARHYLEDMSHHQQPTDSRDSNFE